MPMPHAIICEICGGKFSKHSLAIHQKACVVKRENSTSFCPVCDCLVSNDEYSSHVGECKRINGQAAADIKRANAAKAAKAAKAGGKVGTVAAVADEAAAAGGASVGGEKKPPRSKIPESVLKRLEAAKNGEKALSPEEALQKGLGVEPCLACGGPKASVACVGCHAVYCKPCSDMIHEVNKALSSHKPFVKEELANAVAEAVQDYREECPLCDRKFDAARIAKHRLVCTKASQRKPRKQFKSGRESRMKGTDAEKYIRSVENPEPELPSKWRDQHAIIMGLSGTADTETPSEAEVAARAAEIVAAQVLVAAQAAVHSLKSPVKEAAAATLAAAAAAAGAASSACGPVSAAGSPGSAVTGGSSVTLAPMSSLSSPTRPIRPSAEEGEGQEVAGEGHLDVSSASTMREKPVAVGDRVVLVERGVVGTVQYKGPVWGLKPKGSKWYGIEFFDAPHGKNDGSFKGTTYFYCKQGFGSFVVPDKVRKYVEGEVLKTGTAAPTAVLPEGGVPVLAPASSRPTSSGATEAPKKAKEKAEAVKAAAVPPSAQAQGTATAATVAGAIAKAVAKEASHAESAAVNTKSVVAPGMRSSTASAKKAVVAEGPGGGGAARPPSAASSVARPSSSSAGKPGPRDSKSSAKAAPVADAPSGPGLPRTASRLLQPQPVAMAPVPVPSLVPAPLPTAAHTPGATPTVVKAASPQVVKTSAPAPDAAPAPAAAPLPTPIVAPPAGASAPSPTTAAKAASPWLKKLNEKMAAAGGVAVVAAAVAAASPAKTAPASAVASASPASAPAPATAADEISAGAVATPSPDAPPPAKFNASLVAKLRSKVATERVPTGSGAAADKLVASARAKAAAASENAAAGYGSRPASAAAAPTTGVSLEEQRRRDIARNVDFLRVLAGEKATLAKDPHEVNGKHFNAFAGGGNKVGGEGAGQAAPTFKGPLGTLGTDGKRRIVVNGLVQMAKGASDLASEREKRAAAALSRLTVNASAQVSGKGAGVGPVDGEGVGGSESA